MDKYSFCFYCKKEHGRRNVYVNQAKKKGLPIYCNQVCAGLARRSNKTVEQKKAEKAKYDKKYRDENFGLRTFQGAMYFFWDYQNHPEKFKKKRQKKQAAHNEYCRQPEYKKYKKVYDRKHRAEKRYGAYYESAIALLELAAIVDNRKSKQEQGIINKSQKRKRNAKNTQRKELESCTMGLYQQR